MKIMTAAKLSTLIGLTTKPAVFHMIAMLYPFFLNRQIMFSNSSENQMFVLCSVFSNVSLIKTLYFTLLQPVLSAVLRVKCSYLS